MAQIPLHCSVCPKKPNFSDVSHLLTHIASKGHLSNYYKIKVRSSSEDASRRSLEAYDRWYTEWHVENLMSERMSQKDKRRTRAKAAARAMPAPPTPTVEAPAPRSARSRMAVSSLLDPRLSQDDFVNFDRPVMSTLIPQTGPVLRNRAFPRVHYWPTDSRSASQSFTNPDYETSSDFSEPAPRNQGYQYPLDDFCAVDDDPVDTSTNLTEDSTSVSENTKLKGVIWPGMNIFDSATFEMARKRNQKKDSSVVEQLELNSQKIEANELIFTPKGSFKKQRRLSSSVYDEEELSPVRGETTRPALGDSDANASRGSIEVAKPATFFYLPRAVRKEQAEQAARAQAAEEQAAREAAQAQAAREAAQAKAAQSVQATNYGYVDRGLYKQKTISVYQDQDASYAQPAASIYHAAAYLPNQSPPDPPAPMAGHRITYDEYSFDDNKENIAPAYHIEPSYDYHHRQSTGYNYHGGHPHGYAHGYAHDQNGYRYQNQGYQNPGYMNGNSYQQHPHHSDDTLTASPSMH